MTISEYGTTMWGSLLHKYCNRTCFYYCLFLHSSCEFNCFTYVLQVFWQDNMQKLRPCLGGDHILITLVKDIFYRPTTTTHLWFTYSKEDPPLIITSILIYHLPNMHQVSCSIVLLKTVLGHPLIALIHFAHWTFLCSKLVTEFILFSV